MSDPIADLLTRIRNASQGQKKYAVAPYSKIKENILRILQAKGFIANYKLIKEDSKSFLQISLKYDEYRQPIIRALKRISKCGQRKYVKVEKIPRVLGGIGVSIISTPQGLLEGEDARRKNTGGELLCIAW